MDGKQLKNSILQWAIQGKLVPQNPKDEPASKLLERIAAIRHSEQSEESSKRSKKTSKTPPSRIYRENGVWYEQIGNAEPKDISEDVPFEIPENWAWCRLNHLTELIEDCPHSTASNEGSGYPLIRTPNIGFGRLDLRGVHRVSEDVYNKRNARAIPQSGDLIFAREAPAGNIAVIQEGEIVCLGQRTVLIRPKKDLLNADYLAFYILSPISQQMLVGKSTGTTVAHVNLADFRPYFIALPPLAEQKRIVAKLEQVLPLAEEYGAAQEQLDKLNKELPEALKKSILQQAIQGKLVPQNPKDEPAQKLLERIALARHSERSEESSKRSKKTSKDQSSRIYCENGTWYEQIGNAEPKDISDEIPFDIPENWTWVRFENVAHRITGKTPERGNSAYWLKGTYPWITISDMSDYGHVASTKECITEAATNLMGEISPKDSLLMSFKLTVGRTSILDIDAYHNEAIITVKPYFDKENIFRNYLFTFLPLISMTGSSKDAIKGMTLNAKSIAALLIPLPPLAEQKRIVTKLEQLFKSL